MTDIDQSWRIRVEALRLSRLAVKAQLRDDGLRLGQRDNRTSAAMARRPQSRANRASDHRPALFKSSK